MTRLTYRIGIDLGGTKMEGIRLSSSGDILQRERLPTPSGDYGATLQQVANLVDQLAPDPAIPVGIGTPGSRSHASGLIRNANSTCLNGRPLLEDLTELLQREVRIANDADCFTLSEAADGAGQAAHTVFGVILGTGVGGGICVNGELLAGINGITGEWGHNPLPAPVSSSRDCYCGRSNCIETWLSGPGLSISYQAATGELIPARAIAELLARGEAAATDVIEQYCQQLAAALAVVINVIDPDIIVFGGGLSNIDLLYERVPKLLAPHVFSDHVATRIMPAKYGDSSGVRGAAWLWP